MIRPGNYAIGADIGGTHITAALVDLQKKIIVPASLQRAAVNAAGSADEIMNAWASCIRSAMNDTRVESTCIAMPGPFDYEKGISLMRGQAKYESLYGLPVKDALADRLQVPVSSLFMENDAACFLQGEVFNGAAASYAAQTVIGITLGTGLGSAVYRYGLSHNADMWQWPFKEGIAEEYLCTRWFVNRWREITGITVGGVREIRQFPVSSEKAKEVFAEFGTNLAEFLVHFIRKEEPAAVVIGGNIARAYDWFGPALTEAITGHFPAIQVHPAILGEEAPLAGAVSSWLQRQASTVPFS